MKQKRWSWLHESCQNPECTSPKAVHAAGGLCKNCYMRQYRRDHPGTFRPYKERMIERARRQAVQALPAMFKKLGLQGYAVSYKDGVLRMSRMGSSMVAEHDFNVHEEP